MPYHSKALFLLYLTITITITHTHTHTHTQERTKDAQFIIISLRNNMFELADRLVGIYKTNNATK
jgi:hypothetical protein